MTWKVLKGCKTPIQPTDPVYVPLIWILHAKQLFLIITQIGKQQWTILVLNIFLLLKYIFNDNRHQGSHIDYLEEAEDSIRSILDCVIGFFSVSLCHIAVVFSLVIDCVAFTRKCHLVGKQSFGSCWSDKISSILPWNWHIKWNWTSIFLFPAWH